MSENGFFKNIPGKITRDKLQLNERLVIFLIFIGIATFIWFLWTLEKEYTTVISNPVEFVGIPSDRVLSNDLPEKIQLDVTGRGYALLRHNWDITKSSVQIDFKHLHPEQLDKDNLKDTVLNLDKIKSRLNSQLNNIRVNSVIPDEISFKFARMVKKMVPVKADLDLELEKQYMVRGGIKIIPDSVEISGPSVILDTINSIFTSSLKLRKVDQDIKRNLSLPEVHEKLSISKKRVQVIIPVEQFTEKTLEVPVYGINVPDSLQMKLFPASVQLTFRVVVSEFEAIQPEFFSLSVDFSKVADGNTSKLIVHILVAPEYISNIKIHPETVDFILEE